jgi:ribosome-binding protein aMBF1 (putative translation factor)
MSKRTNGDVLNELAQVGVRAQGGLKKTDPVKALAHLAPSKEAPKKKKTNPPTASTPVGDEWTQEKIREAMEREGLTGRDLAEKLESKNGTPPNKLQVNRWGRGAEKIPSHYWSQLDRIFGGGK